MKFIEVPGDGNCFFHCVSKGIEEIRRIRTGKTVKISHRNYRELCGLFIQTRKGHKLLKEIGELLPKSRKERLSQEWLDLYPFLKLSQGSINTLKVKDSILNSGLYVSELEVSCIKSYLNDLGIELKVLCYKDVHSYPFLNTDSTIYLLLHNLHYTLIIN